MIHTHFNIVYISPLLPVSVSPPIVLHSMTVAAAALIILLLAQREGEMFGQVQNERRERQWFREVIVTVSYETDYKAKAEL